jgi:2-oxoglutarate ferredoxin oxidoreductase subunit alpha
MSKPPKNAFRDEKYLPYIRDEKEVRPWVKIGTTGYEHRVGGLEKELLTGNVSYDPINHEKMVEVRAKKIEGIVSDIPQQTINRGKEGADLCLLSWGSTFGAIETAVRDLIDQGVSVAHIHLRYLNPFPSNLGTLLKSFGKVAIPEMNKGQLSILIRDKFLIDVKTISKMQGLPYSVDEIKDTIQKELGYDTVTN